MLSDSELGPGGDNRKVEATPIEKKKKKKKNFFVTWCN